jgi:hypothetical protein
MANVPHPGRGWKYFVVLIKLDVSFLATIKYVKILNN